MKNYGMIVLMEQFLVYMSLIIFGLCFGSFAGATMWRLRAKQLIQDKKDGEHVNKAEYSRLAPYRLGTATNNRLF